MDLTIGQSDTDPSDETRAERADEIRGMMPTFSVWQTAQHTLKVERAAATVARERAIAASGRRSWPLLAGLLYVIELRGDVETPRTKQIYDRVVVSFTAGG